MRLNWVKVGKSDDGYIGEHHKHCKCPRGFTNPDETEAMQQRVRNRQETVNNRFKNWLGHPSAEIAPQDCGSWCSCAICHDAYTASNQQWWKAIFNRLPWSSIHQHCLRCGGVWWWGLNAAINSHSTLNNSTSELSDRKDCTIHLVASPNLDWLSIEWVLWNQIINWLMDIFKSIPLSSCQ